MSETRYDWLAAAQIAAFLALAAALIVLIAIWLSTLVQNPLVVPIQTTPGRGGWEDGTPNETLNVESPEDPSDDPSLSNDQDVSELEQVREQVTSLSQTAAALLQPNDFTSVDGGGNPGSAEGTGGRPLGSGGPGSGGAKREQHWIVQFADKSDLKLYARQLDFFNIEVGCVFRDGRVFYVSHFSSTPVVREENISSGDLRLFMRWEGGDRIQADIKLLKQAGVPEVESGTILHFYPLDTEQLLARLEKEYGGHPPHRIRRTNFLVRSAGGGFEFIVTGQRLN